MDKYLGIGKWHTRLTLISDIKKVEQFIHTLSPTKYILCDELNHYHCYFETQTSKKILRELITGFAGSGNEHYQLTAAKNTRQLKKYILKDGNYTYKGFSDDEIEIFHKLSNKKGMTKLQKELDLLLEKYYGNNLFSTRQLIKSILLLKDSYGQPTNPNTLANRIAMYERIKTKNYTPMVNQIYEKIR